MQISAFSFRPVECERSFQKQMREMFVILLSEVSLYDPKALFEKNHESM